MKELFWYLFGLASGYAVAFILISLVVNEPENWTKMIKLLILIAVILAVDIAWWNIDPISFNSWGWIVVTLFGFAAGAYIGSTG